MKINRTRRVDSLQPDTRNGHKPAVTVQFWGDMSLSARGTTKGPGKKLEAQKIEPITEWWKDLHAVDAATLKDAKPMIQWSPPQKKRPTLGDLISKFTNGRNR